MTSQSSLTSGHTAIGKSLIRGAVRFGRLVHRVENRVLHSRSLIASPSKSRQFGFQILNTVLLLGVAAVLIMFAVGMVVLSTLAALPISVDRKPRIFEVSHPRHQESYPELYDEYGALK